jgi:hypothetical protein
VRHHLRVVGREEDEAAGAEQVRPAGQEGEVVGGQPPDLGEPGGPGPGAGASLLGAVPAVPPVEPRAAWTGDTAMEQN